MGNYDGNYGKPILDFKRVSMGASIESHPRKGSGEDPKHKPSPPPFPLFSREAVVREIKRV